MGKVFDLKLPPSTSVITKTIHDVKRIAAIRKLKKQYHIDCTISVASTANFVNVFSRNGDKIIATIHNCLSKRHMTLFRKLLDRYTNNKADLVVGVSGYVSDDLIRNFHAPKDRTITIYNHINASLLTNTDKPEPAIPHRQTEDDFVFANMGRLDEQKAQWHLLRAFAEALRTAPNARLIILGQGEDEQRLKQLAKDLDIADRVEFPGYVEGPGDVLRACDAFVFPSLHEGFGLALAEAMAVGLPVIASDCAAGPRELLAPDTGITPERCREMSLEEYGILTPVCDGGHFNATDPLTREERELAKAMVTLYNDRELRERYSELGKRRAADFSEEAITAQWVRVIDGLVGE